MSVCIVLVLALMAGWIVQISDVKGAFLKGDFDTNKDKIEMKVPKVDNFYPDGVVLQFLKAIYGTKQSAMRFGMNY